MNPAFFRFMLGLKQLSDQLRSVLAVDMEEVLLREIRKHKGVLIRLNQDQLLLSGQDSEGNMLEAYHSEWYANRKLLLNPAGVTDLRLSGKFYASFFVEVEDFPLIFGASDSKTQMLIDKYGKNIFGLSEESKRFFIDNYLKEAVLKYYQRVLRL